MKNKIKNIYFKLISIIVLILCIYCISYYSYGAVYMSWEDMYDNDENIVESDIRNVDNYMSYYNILNDVNYNKLSSDEKKIYKNYCNVLINSMKKTSASQYGSYISNLNSKLSGSSSSSSGSGSSSGSNPSSGSSSKKDLNKLYSYLDGKGEVVLYPPDKCDMAMWTEYYNTVMETNAEDIDKKYLDKYLDFLEKLNNNPLLNQAGNKQHLEQIKREIQEVKKRKDLDDSQKKKIDEMENKSNKNEKDISDQEKAEKGELKDELNPDAPIYKEPNKISSGNTSEQSLNDMISDGDAFTNQGNIIYNSTVLQGFSKTFYNIVLTVGIFVAVIIGGILGIKFMVSGLEEKAEVKKMLIIYLIGCIVVFGGFGIWKIIVDIMQNVWG